MLAFGPSLHPESFACGQLRLFPGLRVVVTGRRHGVGALSVRGGSILFIVSPSSLRHLSVVSPSFSHRSSLLSPHRSSSLSPVVFPSFFLLIGPLHQLPAPATHSTSSSAQGWRRVLGRSSSSTRCVCHVPPLFPPPRATARGGVVWCRQPSLPVV